MEIKIQLIIESYKEEITRLINENIILKAQIKQLQNIVEQENNKKDVSE